MDRTVRVAGRAGAFAYRSGSAALQHIAQLAVLSMKSGPHQPLSARDAQRSRPRYKSSTSRAERAREQHSSIWSLAACSSGVR